MVTVTTLAKSTKLKKMHKKLKKEGISKEDAYIHVGECMDYDDTIHTSGDLYFAMHSVLMEAMNVIKDDPVTTAKLMKHFGMKDLNSTSITY